MVEGNVGDVNLVEWSHELDRCLLRFAFRPLCASVEKEQSAHFLYKLAYSPLRKEVGLLLLDSDACTAFYEGISLRTLERRTRIHQPQEDVATSTDDAARLAHLIDAIHHALDPTSALDTALKISIGIESNRFSSSLSISVKSKSDDIRRELKTSFDLDPLDHAALATLLSTHFVRPLLALAAVLSHSATQHQLDSIHQHVNLELHPHLFSDSLELLRRSALANAGLPIGSLQLLSTHAHAHNAKPAIPTPSSSMMNVSASVESDDDRDTEMLFFGPPGLQSPHLWPSSRNGMHKNLDGQQQPASPGLSQELNSDEGDRTLTAPRASASRAHTTNSEHALSPPRLQPQRQSPAAAVNEDDDSDTSEEQESLLVFGAVQRDSSWSSSSLQQQQPSPPISKAEQDQLGTTRGIFDPNLADSQTKPEITPPPASLAPSCSQTSPSRNKALREEQQRRREQIARIKRGQGDNHDGASAYPLSSFSSHPGSRPSAATDRKSVV